MYYDLLPHQNKLYSIFFCDHEFFIILVLHLDEQSHLPRKAAGKMGRRKFEVFYIKDWESLKERKH